MKEKLKKLTFKEIVVIVILAILFSIGTFTLAKYVIEEFHSYFMQMENFYFTSNRLKKGNATYMVNNWSGVGGFDISFDLSSEKNSYVYSDYDIPYTVTFTCPNGVTCTLDKPSGTIYRTSTTHSDTVTLRVVPSRNYSENERLEISISAESVSPYVEEITADFIYVVGKQGITYEIEDEGSRPYMVFKITSAINYCKVIQAFGDYAVDYLLDSSIYRQLSDTDKAKCACKGITLDFNPNVILMDTTSNILNTATYQTTPIGGVDYINQLTFRIDPLSTMAIKFYKTNPVNNYTYPSANNNTSIVTVTTFD